MTKLTFSSLSIVNNTNNEYVVWVEGNGVRVACRVRVSYYEDQIWGTMISSQRRISKQAQKAIEDHVAFQSVYGK